MKEITFPLKLGTKSPEVSNLQEALQLLLDKAIILQNDEAARQELSAGLQEERAKQIFGDFSAKVVSIFQKEQNLKSSNIDKKTVNALNGLLQEKGLLPTAESTDTALDTRYTVLCCVVDLQGKPIAGLRVEAFDQDPKSPHDPLGEPAITDAGGMVLFRFKSSDFTEHPGEKGPDLYFKVYRKETLLDYSLPSIRNDNGVIRGFQQQREAITIKIDKHYVVTGVIVQDNGLPAQNLNLFIYNLGFGGSAIPLHSPNGGNVTPLHSPKTDSQGHYSLTYNPGTTTVNLELRIKDPEDPSKEIPLVKPRFAAEAYEIFNLISPSATMDPEYKRMSADLKHQIGEMTRLVDARENAKNPDLTMLNRATGWDARLIALAATSERLSADENVKLQPEAVYGLLRAGLPSDKLMLAQVEPEVSEKMLRSVRDAGIVGLTDQEIEQFKSDFITFSKKTRLAIQAPGSSSTYGKFLDNIKLKDDDPDKGQKDEATRASFTSLYFSNRGDTASLWQKAIDKGIAPEDVSTLKLQGKLAFLAGNNELMTTHLMQKRINGEQINDPVSLVEQDLYRSDKWNDEIKALAGNDSNKIKELIPAAYIGENVDDLLDAYTEDMARKVRLSYPTQVVLRMIEKNEIVLPVAKAETVKLLKNAVGKGFRLGQTPVEAFIKTHPEVADGIAESEISVAKQQKKMLQRVYQITTSNEAINVLINLGITSAFQVTSYSNDVFTKLFDDKYLELYGKAPMKKEALLIFLKAKQVSSVTYNLFTIAKKMDSEQPIAGISAPLEIRKEVRNNLIKQFPTMESLFGSMDFCECEHCRSVLSPAAYLVDLLQFLDPETGTWASFLAYWRQRYNEQEYTTKYRNPYDVLVERRPDIPCTPLTCENTNTSLPYIDIVNEILEYYVANGKLDEEAAEDTGEATTSELLAEPQNVISEAYHKLIEARYPLDLPFDLWIETVRQFCNYFETPLPCVLEVFRRSDDIFAPDKSFDNFSIFIESLGFSPAEAAIFTDPDPLAKWYELYGFSEVEQATNEATDASTGELIDLNSAKALSRRLGVTYKEIVEIIQTGFVNPQLTKLSILYKLGVKVNDARFYLDHKELLQQDRMKISPEEQKWYLEVEAFSEKLDKLAETFSVATTQITKTQLEDELKAIPFDGILVLADPNSGCNFDQTILRFANGAPADEFTFLKINLFVRMWRKLGWSIEETDRALQAFVPRNSPFEVDNLAKQPLKTALIYLSHLKSLDEKTNVGKQSLIKLITLWSDIPTTGRNSLYAQLFLRRNVQNNSPFDHPLGQYLSADINLKLHMLALQGALGLTANEIELILKDAKNSLDIEDTEDPLDTAKLSLPNVSLLYRYGLLSKALKLSVRELITLKQLSGLDPFKQLHPEPLVDTPPGATPEKKAIDFDYPFSHTLRFVEVVEKVKQSGLRIEDLEYLLLHRFDETGKYRPNLESTLAFLKTLAEGIHAIRKEHAVPEDPSIFSEEMLRQKLGLILSPDVVERFLSMITGTAEFTATKAGVEPENILKKEEFADEPAVREVSYNDTRREQKLTFRGVLFDAEKAALKARIPNPYLSDLLDDVQQQARSFFVKYLQKQTPDIQPATGFLDETDFDLLFDSGPIPVAGETEQEYIRREQEHIRNKRTKLARAFLPALQKRLIRQFIIQTMTAYTSANPLLVESLLSDERLLACPRSLLETFTFTGERGVDADFFDSADRSGVRQPTIFCIQDADMALKDKKDKDGNTLNPANSALLEGYLEVPTPGAYRFYVALDKQGSEAEMHFSHLPDPVFLKGEAAVDNALVGDKPGEFLELKSGLLYHFSLELKKLNGGGARLLVQGEDLPKGSISQLKLYPLSAIKGAENAVLLLTKTLQLVQSLGLNEREIRYFLTHAEDFEGMNLSKLPTQPIDDTPTELANKLFAQFLRLADYSRLKRDLANGTDDIIDIFEANGTGDMDKVYSLIAKLTRRDKAVVETSVNALVATPAFENEKPFACEKPLKRLWDVLQVVERFGVQVASLLDWTYVVSPAISKEQRFVIARDLKEVIKAHFEPETWQRIAQPIFDKLRQRQRDALVAHVMHQHGFASMEQLYEYFLIDPGMEPVVQTSRIRLAIASVQLFIQRCLLNMEPQVHPSVINSKQWEWMKRYRVWEANRKIFLFPENWLEPEFRDDKTYLFTELEGALLQGDVSSDLVEDAFLNYLKKLDELARLDIVAMHLEDKSDPSLRILHVIGRTYSQPHKYFYRRYKHQMWTPWEPVSAEIESDHISPVIWRGRLYLFWVTFMDKMDENVQPGSKTKDKKVTDASLQDLVSDLSEAGKKKQIDMQLHWSEYLQGGWSTCESGGFVPVEGDSFKIRGRGNVSVPLTVPFSFNLKSVFIHVSVAYYAGEERGVFVHLGGVINKAFYLAGRNSSPEIKPYEDNDELGVRPDNRYSASKINATRYTGTGELKVTFKERITTGIDKTQQSSNLSILKQDGTYTLLPCNNNLSPLDVSKEAYQDAENPAAVKAAIESGLQEISSLIKPIFYQDNEYTFFLEPEVIEKTIEDWQEWIPPTLQLDLDIQVPDLVKEPWEVWKPYTPDTGDPWEISIDPGSLISAKSKGDWLINSATGLLFDDVVIGPTGQVGLEISTVESAGLSTESSKPVNINPGSGLGASSNVVLTNETTFEKSGMTKFDGGINIVGNNGFNSVLAQNYNELKSSGLDIGKLGNKVIER